MAVDVNVGDIIQARLEFSLGTDRAFNVLHWQVFSLTTGGLPSPVGVPTQDFLPDFGLTLYNNLKVKWAAVASQDVVFDGITTQDVSPAPRSAPYTYIPGAPVSGAVVSDSLPLQDAPTLLKKTRFGQRWGVGRIFYVGLTESEQTDGVVEPAAVAGLNTFAAECCGSQSVNSDGVTVVMKPVVFQPGHAARPGRPAVAMRITPCVGGQLSDRIIKTQRRRRPGKGI